MITRREELEVELASAAQTIRSTPGEELTWRQRRAVDKALTAVEAAWDALIDVEGDGPCAA